MDSKKFSDFIDAVINKTKRGVISWERLPSTSSLAKQFSPSKSFICKFANGRMLLALDKASGAPECFISPEISLPYQRISSDNPEEVDGKLLRLYNLVYSQFPSVESFIDAMIQFDADPNDVHQDGDLPF